VTLPPLERLAARLAVTGAPLCVGIDPDPAALPRGIRADADGIRRFAEGMVRAAAPFAAAVKFNVAFFEAYGAEGWHALEAARAAVPAELFVVIDAKRGDIGPTAERYAVALLGHLGADAVTVSPYLGEDAVEPFLAHPGRVVYLLTRTSNPSAGRWQDLEIGGAPLHQRIAQWAAERWTDGRVGLVVGATAPEQLRRLRAAVPEPAFLVPGVGAQGGDLPAAVQACHGERAPGLVNVSRAIAAAAAEGGEWEERVAAAARAMRDRMRDAGAGSAGSIVGAATLAREHRPDRGGKE
jgi:orotidine 5'-phosphate decarboxylase subfamily 2